MRFVSRPVGCQCLIQGEQNTVQFGLGFRLDYDAGDRLIRMRSYLYLARNGGRWRRRRVCPLGPVSGAFLRRAAGMGRCGVPRIPVKPAQTPPAVVRPAIEPGPHSIESIPLGATGIRTTARRTFHKSAEELIGRTAAKL